MQLMCDVFSATPQSLNRPTASVRQVMTKRKKQKRHLYLLLQNEARGFKSHLELGFFFPCIRFDAKTYHVVYY